VRRIAAIAFLLGASCSSRVNTKIDLAGEPGLSIAVFAVFAENGVLKRVTPPLGLESGMQVFGERPEIELSAGEDRVVLIRMTEDVLAAAYPGFDLDRREALTADVDLPPIPAVRRLGTSGTDVFLDGGLPEGAVFSLVPLDGKTSAPPSQLAPNDSLVAAARAGIELTVPVDVEYCRDDALPPIVPFGARPNILNEVNPNPGRISEVARVDDDTMIAVTSFALYVLRRGRQASADGEFVFNESFPPGVNGKYVDVAIDPTSMPDGSRRMLAMGSFEITRDEGDGYLFVLRHDPAGRIEHVRTATVVPGAAGRSVAYASNGDLVALMDRGVVFVGSGDATDLVRADIPPAPGPLDESRHVVYTGDPEHPWLAATRGRFHLFDRMRSRWETTQVMNEVQESLHFNGIDAKHRADGSPIRWAAASRGPYFRFDGMGWGLVEPILPPRATTCAEGGTAEFPLRGTLPIESLAVRGEYVYSVWEGCSLLFEMRDSDHCVAIREIEGRPPRLFEDLFECVREHDGELFVAGHAGLIYSTGR
jgi:hypothetical protein